jgi:hypothetical protein
VGQRASDLPVEEVLGDGAHVVRQLVQPGVVVGRDAVAEDVDLLGLAREAGGQLLGDEDVRPVGDLERARDRVVIRDRHEVHAPALGQLVDLVRWRRALGQAERSLHAQLRQLRGGGVDVQVDAADGGHRCSRRVRSPGSASTGSPWFAAIS